MSRKRIVLRPYKRKPIPERFWPKVKKTDSCWLWLACVDWRGYGWINIGGKPTKAHRVSWELHNGPIPDGLMVLHKCDNPPCVNPEHLFLGDQFDNMRDASAKRRLAFQNDTTNVPRGEKNGWSKLTDAGVLDMRARRARGEKVVSIANDYGIHRKTAGDIILGRTWKHLLPKSPQ